MLCGFCFPLREMRIDQVSTVVTRKESYVAYIISRLSVADRNTKLMGIKQNHILKFILQPMIYKFLDYLTYHVYKNSILLKQKLQVNMLNRNGFTYYMSKVKFTFPNTNFSYFSHIKF